MVIEMWVVLVHGGVIIGDVNESVLDFSPVAVTEC